MQNSSVPPATDGRGHGDQGTQTRCQRKTPRGVGWGRGMAGSPAWLRGTGGQREEGDTVLGPAAFTFLFPSQDVPVLASTLGHTLGVQSLRSGIMTPRPHVSTSPLKLVPRPETKSLWCRGLRGLTWQCPAPVQARSVQLRPFSASPGAPG